MADALRATPSAEVSGFRSSMPQAGGCGAERISGLHLYVSCLIVPTWTVLNSTPRAPVRGIPYPLTIDSVRCHA
jgi:hypothetical protein